MTKLLTGALVLVNILAFLMYGYDKFCAKRGSWRVPEATLLFIALAGGSFGAYAGMKKFHHKTMKPIFSVGVPACMVIHTALILIKLAGSLI